GVDKGELALMGDGGRLRGMIVAHQGKHAAIFRGPRKISVADGVPAAVHARPFAVPQREHAIVPALAGEFRLLRTPACRGRQFLVESRLEENTSGCKFLARLPHLEIEPAKGGAA